MATKTENTGRPGRGRWRIAFYAALAKSGSIPIAAKAAGVTLNHVYKLKRTDSEFKARCDDALARYASGRASGKIAAPKRGRKRGRPRAQFDRDSFLAFLAETGSERLAARLIGRSHVGMIRRRARDPGFDAQCNEAKTQARILAAIDQTWARRLHALRHALLHKGGRIDVACEATGISRPLALALCTFDLKTMHAQQTGENAAGPLRAPLGQDVTLPANRFRTGDAKRLEQFTPDSSIRARSPDWTELEARLLPEQRMIVDLIGDESLSVDDAAQRAGRTLEQVRAWADVNPVFGRALALANARQQTDAHATAWESFMAGFGQEIPESMVNAVANHDSGA